MFGLHAIIIRNLSKFKCLTLNRHRVVEQHIKKL